jgi:hypothetical protein
MLAEAFPQAPVIAVICDNDSIHHARKVTAYLKEHPRLELLYGVRYSPHDNPAERIWAALKNYVANTAVTWPGRLKQIHAFFRAAIPSLSARDRHPGLQPGLFSGACGASAYLFLIRLAAAAPIVGLAAALCA